MKTQAKVICHSLAPCGKELVTWVATYHRWILAEVNTARVFSRNSASSRAIPVSKMLAMVQNQPAMPVEWGANQRGMQAEKPLGSVESTLADKIWLDARDDAVKHASKLAELGVHKQVTNRLLEPFCWTTSIISTTELENFFAQRAHKDAAPEFQELAFLMLEAYLESTPRKLAAGQWHLPFADKYVPDGLTLEQLLKIVTARCARVSYLNFEGDIDFEKDYKLHDDLLASGHFSPFEGAARAEAEPLRSGNFIGFTQYRQTLPRNVLTLSREEMAARLGEWKRAKKD